VIYAKPGNMRLAFPGGGCSPIGSRIVELSEEQNTSVACDPRCGFVAYVPKGRLAKG
jgi:hypothetical protein